MMFLITGCGRSGTLYAATVLRAAGLDVGHEAAGKDGAVSSHWAVDDVLYPTYHQQGPRPQFDVILHQVREPLATIASLTTSRADSWLWNVRHVSIELLWSTLRIAADYWLQWNRIAEEQAILTYRVENMAGAWPRICEALSLDAQFPEGISTSINSRQHQQVSWQNIHEITPRYGEIVQMARRYGYPAP